MKKTLTLSAATAAFLILTGCGSSSSYYPGKPNPTDITVVDGYITDGNVTDATGAQAVEDNVTVGLYHFANPVVYPISFTIGTGRNVDTNTTMDINMSAYGGSVISPITTIVEDNATIMANLAQVLGDSNTSRLAQDYIENNDTNASELAQLCYAMLKDTNATQPFLQHIGPDFNATADANVTALIDNTIANDVYYYGTTYFLKALSNYDGSIADMETTLAARNTVIGTYKMLGKAELKALIADYTNEINATTLKSRYAQNIIFADTSAVTDMSALFKNNTTFDLNISGWDTSKVTTLASTFQGATSFNQPIGDWNTSKVKRMYQMFMGATAFNAPIGNWDTSKVKWFDSMFKGATSFNQPIGNWNTVNGQYMDSMFQGATSFNQPLGNWNTINAGFMDSMFQNATSFYQDLSSWDTSSAYHYSNFATGAAFETNASLQPVWVH